jgi:hypothetical protein
MLTDLCGFYALGYKYIAFGILHWHWHCKWQWQWQCFFKHNIKTGLTESTPCGDTATDTATATDTDTDTDTEL